MDEKFGLHLVDDKFPLIKLAKKLKGCNLVTSMFQFVLFPLIKLAKKLKVEELFKLSKKLKFPLIKLAKKLKGIPVILDQPHFNVSIN